MDVNNDKTPIKVGLAQINNRFSGQVYYPLSIGLLQAYAQENLVNPNCYQFLPFIYARTTIEDGVKKLIQADIAGFSTYVWNFQLSLKIAESLKRQNPETIIVFGGPHVPHNSEEYLRKYPFIDIACHGEGEKVFLEVLKYVPKKQWHEIPSVSYISEDGSYKITPKVPRIKNLSEIPSPYLSGTFDQLITDNPEENWIAMWETNRGCPYSCSFCDWGSAVATKIHKWDMERLFKEMEWFALNKIEYIFCADANFGILPRDIEIAELCAQTKKKYGYPHAISIQATKNVEKRSYHVQKILSDAKMNKAVVLSMQSLNPRTLKAIGRENIKSDVYKNLQIKFASEGIETMTDLLLGLPEETYRSWVEGVDILLNLGQHNRIHLANLSILPNAEMGDREYQKKYGMETVISEVVNIHGSLPSSKEVIETQELVIATHTLPREEWILAQVFSWMTQLIYFDKLLQIPIIILHRIAGLNYGEILKFFSEVRFGETDKDSESFPVFTEIKEFFSAKARDMQNGGVEYCHASQWLDIYWPVDEYVLIKLCIEDKLDAFYKEAEAMFELLLERKKLSVDNDILKESIKLNRHHIKLPFQKEDLTLTLFFNTWEFYKSVTKGKPVELKQEGQTLHINRTEEKWATWNEWCQKVIWYGNRKKAYLYDSKDVGFELEGHY